jgi:hypothetical protein
MVCNPSQGFSIIRCSRGHYFCRCARYSSGSECIGRNDIPSPPVTAVA